MDSLERPNPMSLYYEDPSKQAELAGELVRLAPSCPTWDAVVAYFKAAGYTEEWYNTVLVPTAIRLAMGVIKPVGSKAAEYHENHKAMVGSVASHQACLTRAIDEYRMVCPEHKHVTIVFSHSKDLNEQLRCCYESRRQLAELGEEEPDALTNAINKLEAHLL